MLDPNLPVFDLPLLAAKSGLYWPGPGVLFPVNVKAPKAVLDFIVMPF